MASAQTGSQIVKLFLAKLYAVVLAAHLHQQCDCKTLQDMDLPLVENRSTFASPFSCKHQSGNKSTTPC
eukprot:33436-Amphidinium_carterae.1